MLFWIFVILFVLACIGGCIFKYKIHNWHYGNYENTCWCISVVTGFIITVMLFIMSLQYLTVPGQIAVQKTTYESLSYQVESNMYDNDNDIGKKELMDQVTEYNANVQKNKALQRNFWVGIFYPDIWDQFETIPLEVQKGE